MLGISVVPRVVLGVVLGTIFAAVNGLFVSLPACSGEGAPCAVLWGHQHLPIQNPSGSPRGFGPAPLPPWAPAKPQPFPRAAAKDLIRYDASDASDENESTTLPVRVTG